jgi:hypothetical protein
MLLWLVSLKLGSCGRGWFHPHSRCDHSHRCSRESVTASKPGGGHCHIWLRVMDDASVKQAVGELEGGEAEAVVWMWNRRGDPTRIAFATLAEARTALVHGCVAVGVARVDQEQGLPPVIASFSYVRATGCHRPSLLSCYSA